MIILTRLSGQPMAVNPDLIERAEATPDTVITMVDGHKLVVGDSVAAVVEKVRAWRASVAAEAFALSSNDPAAPVPVQPAAHSSAQSGAALARVLPLPTRED